MAVAWPRSTTTSLMTRGAAPTGTASENDGTPAGQNPPRGYPALQGLGPPAQGEIGWLVAEIDDEPMLKHRYHPLRSHAPR